MKYAITRMVLAEVPSITIGLLDYTSIKDAREDVKRLRACEDSFDLLMENYVELENAVLSESLRYLAFYELTYTSMTSTSNLLSRKLINLLSSTRHYLDTLPKHAGFIVDEAAKDVLRKATNQYYDSFLSYRAMEALRNYSQHYAFPVQSVTFDAKRERIDDDILFSFRVTPNLMPELLNEDGDFKSSVLTQLLSQGKQIELLPLVREYVEKLGELHGQFRQLTKPKFDSADELLMKWINQYSLLDPAKSISLAAVKIRDDGTTYDEIYFVEDALNYIKYLLRKNSSTVNLSKRFVKW